MKNNRFYLLILSVIVLLALSPHNDLSETRISTDIIGCMPPPVNTIRPDASGKYVSILPGWGNHSYKVATGSDSAQLYFDQGLSLFYSYHGTEAYASFKEAARFDPGMVMAYWGQALAEGPAYNYSYSYKIRKTVPAIITQLNKMTTNASVKEKDLIDAINSRYDITDTADSKRLQLNQAYATKMQALVKKYPDDTEIKAVYLDAVMVMHEWDFWNNNGTPKPWTPELVGLCETILQKDPRHPGALHYYIHVTEASRNPEVALPGADVLQEMMPGVAHMVHMSSHEYERIGLYEKGVKVNEKAHYDLHLYDSLAKSLSLFTQSPHYLAVDAYCAMSGGMYTRGLSKAINCRNSVKPEHAKTALQYMYSFPVLTMVRLGKWNEILTDKDAPPADWSFSSLLYDFGKGMAYSSTGNTTMAMQYLQQLQKKTTDSILKIPFTPYRSSPYEIAVLAGYILEADILFQQKNINACIATLHKATTVEDNLLYAEPKAWMIPARQYLGHYLLLLKRAPEAEKVYLEDLTWNPGNGWSLLGLYQSLEAQGKHEQAAEYKKRYVQSFSMADEIPPGSVY